LNQTKNLADKIDLAGLGLKTNPLPRITILPQWFSGKTSQVQS